MVKKKITLETKIDALTNIVEKGIAAIATDISDVRTELKGDIAAVHTQVNSIERELRDAKTEIRLGDLEEQVFGQARRLIRP
jgi:hypothetical protein